MRQSLIALTLIIIFAVPCGAGAAEQNTEAAVKLSGSITHEYRFDNNGAANPTIEGHKTLVLLNVKKNIAANFSLYARASYENISNPVAKGAFADFAGSSNNGSIDSFGFQYETAGYKYIVGLQPFTLGPTALLYDGSFAVGRHSMPVVANISGKLGATELTAIAGRTNYYTGGNDKLYALQGSHPLGGKSSFGLVWARVNYGATGGSHDYSSLSITHNLGPKTTLTAEYLRSDYNQDNTAYTAVINYNMDEKNSLCLADWRVERNASILDRRFGYMTTYLGDAAGQMLVWQHRIDKDLTLAFVDLYYSSLQDNSGSGRRNSFRSKLIYDF